MSAFLLLAVGCALALAPPAAAATELGIIYVQPSYHYTNTQRLDMEVLARDLPAIAAKGFANVGLRVSLGDLIVAWDMATGTPTYNESYCSKLHTIAQQAAAHKLSLIFNTHLAEKVPQGLPGAVFRPPQPDIYNVSGGAGDDVYRSVYGDIMVRPDYREPILAFHRKFAACLRPGTGVRYWKHAFESCYLFPQDLTPAQVNATAAAAQAGFARWAQATNASIAHWRSRWGEPQLPGFAQIQLPSKMLHSNTAKYGDYWRFWLLGVLKTGEYGLSIRDIYEALAEGAGGTYAPELGFKHWRASNFLSMTDLSLAELRDAFDLPINITALGYYVNDPAALAGEPAGLRSYINVTRSVAPPNLPILIWETGASTLNLTQEQQRDWGQIMLQVVAEEKVLGANWWQFIDWAPLPNEAPKQILHFGAHNLDGSPKLVWDVL